MAACCHASLDSLCQACGQAVAPCDVTDHAEVCRAAASGFSPSREWLYAVGVPRGVILKRLGIGEVLRNVLDFACPLRWWEEYVVACPMSSSPWQCAWRGWRSDVPEHMHLHHEEVTCDRCRVPLSRFELRSHTCASSEKDYEVACHACGATVWKSEVVSGSHAMHCEVHACLVMVHGAPGCFRSQTGLFRCGITRFASPWHLSVELEKCKEDNCKLTLRCESQEAESKSRGDTVLKLGRELEACKKKLEVSQSVDLAKENMTLRTALLHEWKQFRLLEREVLGRSPAINLPETFNEFTSWSEFAHYTTPSALVGNQAALHADACCTKLQAELGPACTGSHLFEREPKWDSKAMGTPHCGHGLEADMQLEMMEAKLQRVMTELDNRTQRLNDCERERRILRCVVFCTVVVCIALAW